MKNFIFLFTLLLTFGFASCEKEDNACENNPHLCFCDCYLTEITFGHFYGECGGEGCVEIFKVDLNNRQLLEDTRDDYPYSDTFYMGDFSIEHPKEKYDLVADLGQYFPESLFEETGNVIGQPDAGDWGGIYFEIRTANLLRFWLLDQMESNMPEEYNEFVDKINEKIAIIHQ